MSTTSARAFAKVASALVSNEVDVVTVLADLMADSCETLDASAAGLLMNSQTPEPEILSATTHSVHELELYQLQSGEGPCVDAVRTMARVSAWSHAEIEHRWGEVGVAITRAGYSAVSAYPLRWRSTCLGALNVFWARVPEVQAEADALGQSLADIATIVVLHPEHLSTEDITRRTRDALNGRTVIEHAKGVLAYLNSVPPDMAYAQLRARASNEGRSLTATAALVVAEASRRRL
ncbi:GAF domain-containing protein [Terrabacter terrae]|uniref:GAF domain-containing protein n=1 Tax=Terrabacter terrae TaxID=318434 RepID=A0ABN2TU51_9MICO